MDRFGWNLGGRIPLCPRYVRHVAAAHWTFCSYGRLEAERVNQFWWNLVYNRKLGPQLQPCDQILKVGGRSLLGSIRNAITRQQMDRLGRSFGGRIPSCSQYRKCYNTSYDGTDWDTSAAKPFPWYLVVTAQWTFQFYGVYRSKNIHNFHETWMTRMTVPLWYKRNIKSDRKTANIITKKPQKFYHC